MHIIFDVFGVGGSFDKNVGGILAYRPYSFFYTPKSSLLILREKKRYNRDIVIHIVSTQIKFLMSQTNKF